MNVVPGLLLAATALCAQPRLDFLNHGRPILDAHNCYPYDGRWADRIDRALSAGFPISIEQDLAWYIEPASAKGRAVIAHDAKAVTGAEPTPRGYFFERIRPIVERALKEGDRNRWPLIILHLDFKTNDTPLLGSDSVKCRATVRQPADLGRVSGLRGCRPELYRGRDEEND